MDGLWEHSRTFGGDENKAVGSRKRRCRMFIGKGCERGEEMYKEVANKGARGGQKADTMVRTARSCGWNREILSVWCVVPGVPGRRLAASQRQSGLGSTRILMEAWGSSGGFEDGHGMGLFGPAGPGWAGSWTRGGGRHMRDGSSGPRCK